MEYDTVKSTKEDIRLIQCHIDLSTVEYQYCATFSEGKGCKFKRLCWNE